jgi:hypothetical protein
LLLTWGEVGSNFSARITPLLSTYSTAVELFPGFIQV